MNELITNLIALFTTAFGSDFKSYEYGMLEIPANSDLPLLTVNPVSTSVVNSGTVRDENRFAVEVVVYVSLKQYLNNVSNNPKTRSALQALVELVEDRETTGEVKAKSVIGVIRQNITASGVVLYNNEISVDYSDYISNAEFPVAKAVVGFMAESRSKRV
jgi:hypothetical protein